jgi:hypothetical protein
LCGVSEIEDGDHGPFCAELLDGSVENSSSTWTGYRAEIVPVGYGVGSGASCPAAFSLRRSRNKSSEVPVRLLSETEELLRNWNHWNRSINQ